MGFEGWGYRFQGPVPLPDYLKPKPGVFIVWCVHDGAWDILDVGDADNIRNFLLVRDHFEDAGGDQPFKIFYSAAYLARPEERIRLLMSIQGPSFARCDLAALKKQKGLSEHERLFGRAMSRRRPGRLRVKLLRVPSLPRKLMRELLKRTRELEKRTRD
ncbi:MAG TPA: hypothetical protein VMS75_06815 [Terriglobales bacterium]|nr:hypothetical protein [Terriglobales bacterium]